MIYRDALLHIRSELVSVIAALCDFAYKYRAMPTLGYTHFQPAQLVTVGKRACLWAQDFLLDLDELNFVIDNLLFHGCRGTTGTDASFLSLFDGDVQKVRELNAMIAEECGFSTLFPVAGQTYPRKYDSRILNVLSAIAQSAYRFANDMRLLQHLRQVEEPFEKSGRFLRNGIQAQPHALRANLFAFALYHGGCTERADDGLNTMVRTHFGRLREPPHITSGGFPRL